MSWKISLYKCGEVVTSHFKHSTLSMKPQSNAYSTWYKVEKRNSETFPVFLSLGKINNSLPPWDVVNFTSRTTVFKPSTGPLFYSGRLWQTFLPNEKNQAHVTVFKGPLINHWQSKPFRLNFWSWKTHAVPQVYLNTV